MKFILLVTLLFVVVPCVVSQVTQRFDIFWSNSESTLAPFSYNASWSDTNYFVWHFTDSTPHSVASTTTIEGIYSPDQLVPGYDPNDPNSYPFRSEAITAEASGEESLFFVVFDASSNATPPGAYYYRDQYNTALTGVINLYTTSAASPTVVPVTPSAVAATPSAAAATPSASVAAATPSAAAATPSASAAAASSTSAASPSTTRSAGSIQNSSPSAAAATPSASVAAATPSAAAGSATSAASPSTTSSAGSVQNPSPSSVVASASAAASSAAASVAASVVASNSRAASSLTPSRNPAQSTSTAPVNSPSPVPSSTTVTPTPSSSASCTKDTDGDGVPDCFDLCPRNKQKTTPSGPYGCRNTPRSSHTVIEFDFDILAPINCTELYD